jgi:hypothetical protein
MKLTGENRSTGGKSCPSASLFSTYPTWTDPGSNRGLRSGMSATNRLSHGAAAPAAMIPERAPTCLLNSGLRGFQGRSGRSGEEKSNLTL